MMKKLLMTVSLAATAPLFLHYPIPLKKLEFSIFLNRSIQPESDILVDRFRR
jgi:hypothetical protein